MLHMKMKTIATVIAATVGLGGAGLAHAAIVSYTSSATFQAALTGQTVTTEGYELPAINSTIANGGSLNGLTYSFSNGAPGRIDNIFNNFDDQSLASASFANGFFLPGESITVSFGAAATAFGVFFNVAQSPAGSLYATTNLGDTALGSNSYDISTLHFVGLISDTAFTSVTFGGTTAIASGFNVDDLSNVRAVQAVPEPGSLALLALALAAVVSMRRRKA